MHEQQTTMPAASAAARPRDPQNFTSGDVIAWKVVAWFAATATVVGSTVAIIVAITLAAA